MLAQTKHLPARLAVAGVTVISALNLFAADTNEEKISPVVIEFRLAEDTKAENLVEMMVDKTDFKIYVHPKAAIANADVKSAKASTDVQGRPAVLITFNADGALKMEKLTKENQGKRLAIFVDGKVIKAPQLVSVISKEAQIVGSFSKDEVESIAHGIMSASSK